MNDETNITHVEIWLKKVNSHSNNKILNNYTK